MSRPNRYALGNSNLSIAAALPTCGFHLLDALDAVVVLSQAPINQLKAKRHAPGPGVAQFSAVDTLTCAVNIEATLKISQT